MAVYLLHLDPPYQHAGHYIGFCDTSTRTLQDALDTRLAYHRAGRGSRLLRAVVQSGGTWSVARTWPAGTRSDERRFKGHSATRLCPICSGVAADKRGLLAI